MGIIDITIREANAEEILELRHTVLRAGLPAETARFPGDDRPATRHFVAVENGRVVGCLTYLRSEWEGCAAWQLRGMAVATDRQRNGIGRQLLQQAETVLCCESREDLFWCNARISAAVFYEKLGWHTVSEVFDVETAGPHVKMIRRVQPPKTDKGATNPTPSLPGNEQ